MTDEPNEKEEITQEERKRMVVTEGALEMALEMETIDKQMGDVRDEMLDVQEMFDELAAKARVLEGKRDLIRTRFWKKIRADEKSWFRKMSEGGLKIMYKRVKDPETEQKQIQLQAFDANDEAIKSIRRIFRREERDDKD